MAHRVLNPKQIDQVKKMVVNGVYPADIANHYNMAVSTVHNYKHLFRNQGITYPSVRGRKAVTAMKPTDVVHSTINMRTTPSNISKKLKQLKFLVNGTAIRVDKEAKSINIHNKQMEICF